MLIGVFEDGEKVKKGLRRCLEGIPYNCEVADMKRWEHTAFDIAVMTKNCGRQVAAKVLICPASIAVSVAKEGDFPQVVTVGFSGTDTVTFSALLDSSLSVCFQREIMPVSGSMAPVGEVIFGHSEEPETDMLIAAVLRSMGVV